MIGKTLAATIIGIDAETIIIEVDLLNSQLPGLAIVGLPDKAVQEAKERILSAIKNTGIEWPRKRITINLAPADMPKSGTGFDLPIALAILKASGVIEFDSEEFLFAGELALDGSIRHINGSLSIALKAKGVIKNLILPIQDAKEASVVEGIDVYGFTNLGEVISFLNNQDSVSPLIKPPFEALITPYTGVDMKNIRGQHSVKRASIIAAAGNHNLLLTGSPGSGKTMISRALPSILPSLTFEEALEITKVYSVANLLSKDQNLITTRPFRSPHHTASTISIVGGGKNPRPGELSLAHRGILFLDEFPEFSSYTLEALRQPIEDKQVIVSRISGTLTFPSNFMLVAAMNPCKCGWFGDDERPCTCTPFIIDRYRKKISGPILDRIDLQVKVPRVKINDLTVEDPDTLDSNALRKIVQKARDIQLERFQKAKVFSNAEIPQKDLELFCKMEPGAKELLANAAAKLNLSARSYFRTIKVSRTIADIDNSEVILRTHVAEALQYRLAEES